MSLNAVSSCGFDGIGGFQSFNRRFHIVNADDVGAVEDCRGHRCHGGVEACFRGSGVAVGVGEDAAEE